MVPPLSTHSPTCAGLGIYEHILRLKGAPKIRDCQTCLYKHNPDWSQTKQKSRAIERLFLLSTIILSVSSQVASKMPSAHDIDINYSRKALFVSFPSSLRNNYGPTVYRNDSVLRPHMIRRTQPYSMDQLTSYDSIRPTPSHFSHHVSIRTTAPCYGASLWAVMH